MVLESKLDKIILRYEQINQKMMDPSSMPSQEYMKIAKERSDLEDIVHLAHEYKRVKANLEDSKEMANDANTDPELQEIAEAEVISASSKLNEIENEIKIALLPKDEADSKNAILEVRAGTGGEEAALFAAVLFRMYQRYSELHGWKFEVLNLSSTGLDGLKEASAVISGKDVYSRLKFESGVHRVQRVPETEASGRVHTSAATVAVLPEVEEVDVQINEADIRIDVFRASGAGGQHVNTTDSAVRITHIPTGIVVSQQDEKSQHKNKSKAMKILLSRIYEAERLKRDTEQAKLRKGQVGSGDRSERIRTYNYPQSRVTDHRINLTLYSLNTIVNEGKIDEFIDALVLQDQTEKLSMHSE